MSFLWAVGPAFSIPGIKINARCLAYLHCILTSLFITRVYPDIIFGHLHPAMPDLRSIPCLQMTDTRNSVT